MGRHSAPSEDDSDDQSSVAVLELSEAADVRSVGRHARQDEPPAVREPVSDFALVRAHRDVRARCVAAVLAPFVVYFVVVLVVGGLSGRTILIWLWPELIIAGVLLGFVLDHAHKRYPR